MQDSRAMRGIELRAPGEKALGLPLAWQLKRPQHVKGLERAIRRELGTRRWWQPWT